MPTRSLLSLATRTLLALPLFGALAAPAVAGEDLTDFKLRYGGLHAGTCGAVCGGVEISYYVPDRTAMADYWRVTFGVVGVGGMGPLIDLDVGKNLFTVGERGHPQLGLVAGAYWFGRSDVNPTESNIGAAGGLQLGYAWHVGHLQLVPHLNLMAARGEGVSPVNGATGVGIGPMIVLDLKAVFVVTKWFMLYGHVGWQVVHLSGEGGGVPTTTGGTSDTYEVAHRASAPLAQIGFAF